MPALQNVSLPAVAEEEARLVRRAAGGEVEAIRQIIRANNQRLYRLVRAVVRSNSDAEDVLQEAYLRAFASLDTFQGDSLLSTWLSRIALNSALMRLRAQKRLKRAASEIGRSEAEIVQFPLASPAADPERVTAQ
ncbi:RNA polymerase sigma factor (sigma-70 family) [Rhizobium azibense]|uniref:RNA polymerase sigma factor n=1 Tax=Rhizobium azibense TaxID=1136135 RepID=A0A4R3QYE1_9HYPH|nr:RNA polymerase sigma factor (sigma-70 family) [Rhizobium azibense]